MNYKLYFYIFFCMASAFALSGVNFDKIFKKNRYFESRILVLFLSLIMGYLVTNLLFDLI